MRVVAAIKPPAGVIDDLADALSDAAPPAGIAWLPPSGWLLRLAEFGFVVAADADRLGRDLAQNAIRLRAPVLRLAGVVPLPESGDDAVWVGLEGSVEAVDLLAGSIPWWVHASGFVPDRRSYRPMLKLGQVTTRTRIADLEHVAERLGPYRGPWWTADAVSLVHEKPINGDAGPGDLEILHTAPFDPSSVPRPAR